MDDQSNRLPLDPLPRGQRSRLDELQALERDPRRLVGRRHAIRDTMELVLATRSRRDVVARHIALRHQLESRDGAVLTTAIGDDMPIAVAIAEAMMATAAIGNAPALYAIRDTIEGRPGQRSIPEDEGTPEERAQRQETLERIVRELNARVDRARLQPGDGARVIEGEAKVGNGEAQPETTNGNGRTR